MNHNVDKLSFFLAYVDEYVLEFEMVYQADVYNLKIWLIFNEKIKHVRLFSIVPHEYVFTSNLSAC